MTSRPLDGITILTLEHAIAAPLCTRQLAELGARVIKIERRGSGDFARHYDTRVKGQSSHFIWTNRSKESMTLDLKHAGAAEILNRLLQESDVLVQNLAPGATAKLGLSFAALQAENPQLIVCDISGYGSAGPYHDKKAYDLLVQAEAGLLSVTGTDSEMVKSGISIADIAAGTQAHSSILAALLQRAKTGTGSHIEISMLEAMIEWMGFPLYYAYDGAAAPKRSGADHASIYPYGVFTTGDNKTLMIGLQNEREWAALCLRVLKQEALIEDDRFRTNPLRSKNRELLRKIIEDSFSDLSEQQVAARLDQAQIAYARVNDMALLWHHPQLRALNRIIEVDTPAGPVSAMRPPGTHSAFDHRID
ncbi:MAG TPA: CaiB/BaiF CoA-transferase family protein, partial [Gammaproteobacteria bacterium]|nr:CaiB/BaiF CoA-transferase family protein [Gammaproteobacteria bacterium]